MISVTAVEETETREALSLSDVLNFSTLPTLEFVDYHICRLLRSVSIPNLKNIFRLVLTLIAMEPKVKYGLSAHGIFSICPAKM